MARYNEVHEGTRVRITRSGHNSTVPVGTEGVVIERDRYRTISGSVKIRLDNGNEHWRSVENVEVVTAPAAATFVTGGVYRVTQDHARGAEAVTGDVIRLTDRVDYVGEPAWRFEFVTRANGSTRAGYGTWIPESALEQIPAAAAPVTLARGVRCRVTQDEPHSAPVYTGDIVTLRGNASGPTEWYYTLESGRGRQTGCYIPAFALVPVDAPAPAETTDTLTHAEVRDLMPEGRTAGMCDVRFELLDALGVPREPVEPTVQIADVIREARALGDAHGFRTQVDEIIRRKGWEPAPVAPLVDGDIVTHVSGSVQFRVYVIGDEKFYRRLRDGVPTGNLSVMGELTPESEFTRVG